LFDQDEEMLLMDHYAGKPGLRVITPFVRSNADTLGRIWNGHFIQKIEIQMSETETCEHRLEYFDRYDLHPHEYYHLTPSMTSGLQCFSNGIVRDVMANHLQLLLGAVIAPSLRHCRSTPTPRRALGDDLPDDLCPHEMTRFVQSLRPLGSVLVGQYEGYNQKRASNRSVTATAAFTHITSTSADWITTNFSVSAAKATAKRRADVRVTFKLGQSVHDDGVPCSIMFTIQNGAGSSGERVQVQCAGLGELNAPASWSLSKAPGEFIPTASLHKQSTATTLPWQLGKSISAYDSLLADAAHGRCDSFMKIDEVLAVWAMWSPIVRAAELVASESIVTYPIGATAWRHFEGIHGTCQLTTPWAPRSCLRRNAASTQPLARGT
jgi:glucose-6-phosphate 1-dehydrogenase